jgi:hypothetical protein
MSSASECNGGGILIDQAGNVSTTMGLTGLVGLVNRDPVIDHCQFADGAMRPIYNDGDRQYVFDDG